LELIQQVHDKSIDVCITDLPYGIDYQSSWNGKQKHFDKIANDKRPFVDFIKYLPRVMKDTGAIYLFTRWDVQQPVIDELQANGMRVKNVLIWDKGNHSMGDLKSSYGSRYESIVFAPMKDFKFQGKRPVDIISVPRVPADKMVHPNEKPVNLLRRLILDATKMGGG
jgi:site-specific DNA-methyltransferase (adenine-specific)